MINPTEAIEIILDSTIQKEPEEVNLIEATNRYSSEDISTKLDLPLWNNSSMDGFAFKLNENFDVNNESINKFHVIGELFPGDDYIPSIKEGEAIKIMTGAPIPIGANCVVPIEKAIIKDTPARNIVQRRPLPIISETGSGK